MKKRKWVPKKHAAEEKQWSRVSVVNARALAQEWLRKQGLSTRSANKLAEFALEFHQSRPHEDRTAIQLMYGALLKVGMLNFHPSPIDESSRLRMMLRTMEIVDAALREMNSKHTALVQEALGIGESAK